MSKKWVHGQCYMSVDMLREDIIWKVWVDAKSQSFPPTRFSMSNFFLESDTRDHVQTQSPIWIIMIFDKNSESKKRLLRKRNYYEDGKLRELYFYEDSGTFLV